MSGAVGMAPGSANVPGVSRCTASSAAPFALGAFATAEREAHQCAHEQRDGEHHDQRSGTNGAIPGRLPACPCRWPGQ